jgi:hypothetical protein
VKLLQAAGVLSLLLILVVVNSLLNGSGGESPFNPNPVAAAAQRTREAPGMKMTMEMTLRSESSPPVTVTGRGSYNGSSNLAEITYRMTAEGQRVGFEAILSESAWYFRYPQLSAQMPDGKEWVKLSGLPGQKDIGSPGVTSPDETLGLLRATGTVRRLGKARVGRVATTRYRVTMTPAQVVAGLRAQGKEELAEQFEGLAPQLTGPVRSEVFIAGDGMLRRMRVDTTEVVDGKAVAATIRMDFFDLGFEPAIAVPDDSQVYDMGPELEEAMEGLGQAS